MQIHNLDTSEGLILSVRMTFYEANAYGSAHLIRFTLSQLAMHSALIMIH